MTSYPDPEIKKGITPPNTPVAKSPRRSESRGSLGRTSGLVAAGAWAARMELANLFWNPDATPSSLLRRSDEEERGVMN